MTDVLAVFRDLLASLGNTARSVATAAASRLLQAMKPKSALGGLIADLTRTPHELRAENAALRHQLIVLSRTTKRPKFKPMDRFLLVVASAFTPTWRDAIMLAKPDTILRWHRYGFRLFWRRKSRSRQRSEPRLSPDKIALTRKMASENATWGAERIRGELLKLGINVAKRTIQRYIMGARSTGNGGQRWATFLEDHTVWACDFVQTYDCWFRPIFAFFIVDVNSKEVFHVTVTRSPGETWTAQQLREVTPFGESADVIIRDRNGKFGGEFDRVAEGAEMRVVQTPVRTPNMNAVCERFPGSVRRECLDHVLILNERHLECVLKEYAFSYFNNVRPHQRIQQRVPVASKRKSYAENADVVAFPILGGLHHDYRVAA